MTTQSKIYIGNLSYDLTKDDLHDAFEPFGEITELKLIVDKATNRSKGYGFITYELPASAKEACDEMNGQELGGRQMKVSIAKGHSNNNGKNRNNRRQNGGRRHNNDNRGNRTQDNRGNRAHGNRANGNHANGNRANGNRASDDQPFYSDENFNR